MRILRDKTTCKPCLQHTVTVSVDLGGEEIADLFCRADDEQMAKFFCRVAEVFAQKGANLPMQLEYVRQNSSLTTAGRAVMRQIGEYAE